VCVCVNQGGTNHTAGRKDLHSCMLNSYHKQKLGQSGL